VGFQELPQNGLSSSCFKVDHLKRETWTRFAGHHMAAGSTKYLLKMPAHPNPNIYKHRALSCSAKFQISSKIWMSANKLSSFSTAYKEQDVLSAKMASIRDLGSYNNEKSNEEIQLLLVENLDGTDYMYSIHMFLHIEWSRIE
jgi:hypothetical protein